MKANKEGWIRHRGGKCPVKAGTLVDVRYRNGNISVGQPALERGDPSAGWAEEWHHSNHPGDIVAYCLHTPSEQPATTKQSAPGEVEEIQVVGVRISSDGFGSYIADSAMGAGAIHPGDVREPLMTVAQHQRIVAQLAARDAGEVPVELLEELLAHIEDGTCTHDNTHRGGTIWEICDDCGDSWADDRGGKPEFKWPNCVEKLRALLAQREWSASHDHNR